jgi:hypothetical protein
MSLVEEKGRRWVQARPQHQGRPFLLFGPSNCAATNWMVAPLIRIVALHVEHQAALSWASSRRSRTFLYASLVCSSR